MDLQKIKGCLVFWPVIDTFLIHFYMKYTTLQCCTKKRYEQCFPTVYCVSHLEKNDGLWTTTLLSFFSAVIFTYIVSKHTAVTKKVLLFFVFSHKIGIISWQKPFTYWKIFIWKCEKTCSARRCPNDKKKEMHVKWQKILNSFANWYFLPFQVCHNRFSLF